MAGTVLLRTNRFEVKLEGITFKAKEFEQLCAMDFLFPKGKVWVRKPIVGLDVMRHPRDPNIVLMLMCFGVGCVILRFRSGESLSEAIVKFLTDKRIRFVGFGFPERRDLFPFQDLGLTKSKADIGYIAAKVRKDPKYARYELAELARKILGIKEMVGLSDGTCFERHGQLKCAICQLFISSVIAMSLLRPAESKKKLADGPKKIAFRKTLRSLPLLNEGWFKISKSKTDNLEPSQVLESFYDLHDEAKYTSADDYIQAKDQEGFSSDDSFQTKSKEGYSSDDSFHTKSKEGYSSDDSSHTKSKGGYYSSDDSVHVNRVGRGRLSVSVHGTSDDGGLSSDDSCKGELSPSKKPLKGILKCPTPKFGSPPSSSPKDQNGCSYLKRANSKGCNVSFKQ